MQIKHLLAMTLLSVAVTGFSKHVTPPPDAVLYGPVKNPQPNLINDYCRLGGNYVDLRTAHNCKKHQPGLAEECFEQKQQDYSPGTPETAKKLLADIVTPNEQTPEMITACQQSYNNAVMHLTITSMPTLKKKLIEVLRQMEAPEGTITQERNTTHY